MDYKTEVELHPGTKFKKLRSDRGGVNMDQEYFESMESSIRQRSFAPQTSGVTERKHQVLEDMVNHVVLFGLKRTHLKKG